MHHHVVRRPAVARPVEDVAGAMAVVVDQVGVLPDHAQHVVVGAGAVDHAVIHQLQADGDQAAATHGTDEAGHAVPVDRAQPWNRSFADVLVDHVSLLHPGLGPGVAAVLDLDDGRRPGPDPVRRSLRGDLDPGNEGELPVGGERVALAVQSRLGDRDLVGMAVAAGKPHQGVIAMAADGQASGVWFSGAMVVLAAFIGWLKSRATLPLGVMPLAPS